MLHYLNNWNWMAVPFGGLFSPVFLFPLFIVVALWSLYWKGLALWRTAQRGEKEWFVALLVINTFGILEILYLYVFSKKSEEAQKNP